jgi:methionyl-tRNA synthetase
MIVRTGLNLVSLFAILALPFVPSAAQSILDALAIPAEQRVWPASDDGDLLTRLPACHTFTVPDLLFAKIEDSDVAAWTTQFGGGG